MQQSTVQTKRQVARDISYASSAETRGGRALIRTMENMTGRIRLIKRADGYEREVQAGRDFWQVMVERYGLTLDLVGGSLKNIPRTGPLIVIANHPYGILDGLTLGHILSQTRGDFRILANHVLAYPSALGFNWYTAMIIVFLSGCCRVSLGCALSFTSPDSLNCLRSRCTVDCDHQIALHRLLLEHRTGFD